MSGWKWLLSALMLFATWGCSHGGAATVREEPGSRVEVGDTFEESEEGVRIKGSTLSMRIWALIGQGQFAEAEALIAEGTASGLLSKPVATQMLDRIALLNTKLGQIPPLSSALPTSLPNSRTSLFLK